MINLSKEKNSIYGFAGHAAPKQEFTHSDHIEFLRKNTYEKFIVRVNKEKQKGELVSFECPNVSYHFGLYPNDAQNVQTQGK
jgi:hypothetical protein